MGGDGETLTGHLMAPGYSNWSAYSVDDIWEMVRHEDGRINWSQYYAWQRMAKLCEEEADQLDKAVNQLVQLWPDRPGTAAEAFKTFVGGMTSSMRETATAATANADALYSLTIHLLTARGRIAHLLEQRAACIQAEQQMIEYAGAIKLPAPGQPIQPAPLVPQPTPDDWREHLDRHARNVMAETDAAIAADTTRFQVPPKYELRFAKLEPQVRPTSPASVPAKVISSTAGVPPPHDLDAPLVQDHPRDAIGPPPIPGQTNHPVLEGRPQPVTIPVDAPTPSGASSHTRYFGGSSPLPNPVLGPGHVIAAPRAGTPPNGVPTGQGAGARPPVTPARTAGSVTSSFAPMIPPPKANQSAGAAGAAIAPAGRTTSPYGHRPKNPNDPWIVSEGVPPILEPSPEPTVHEPGPGVIGIDR